MLTVPKGTICGIRDLNQGPWPCSPVQGKTFPSVVSLPLPSSRADSALGRKEGRSKAGPLEEKLRKDLKRKRYLMGRQSEGEEVG